MQTEDILGAAFHPLDDNLMITYGKGHLTFWTRRKDGFFEKIDIIKAVMYSKVYEFDLKTQNSYCNLVMY